MKTVRTGSGVMPCAAAIGGVTELFLLVYPAHAEPWRVVGLVVAIYAASFVLWFFVERPFRSLIVSAFDYIRNQFGSPATVLSRFTR